MTKLIVPIGHRIAENFKLAGIKIEYPIFPNAGRGIEPGLATIKIYAAIRDFHHEQSTGWMILVPFHIVLGNSDIGFRLRILKGVHRTLRTNPMLVSKNGFQINGHLVKRFKVSVSLGRHFKNFSLQKLNALAGKISLLGHAIVFVSRKATRFGLG